MIWTKSRYTNWIGLTWYIHKRVHTKIYRNTTNSLQHANSKWKLLIMQKTAIYEWLESLFTEARAGNFRGIRSLAMRSLARGGRKQTVYRQESSRRIYLTAADVTEVQKNMPLSKFASPYDSFDSTWKSTRCTIYTICSPRKLKCTRYNFAKTRRPRRARYHLISADWPVHSFRTMRRVGAEKKHAHAYRAPDELCAVMHTVMHCDFLPFPPRRVTSDQQRIRAAPPVSGSFLPNRVPPDRPRWQHCSFAPWQRRHRQLYKQSHQTAHFHHYLKYDRIRRQQGNRRHQTSPPPRCCPLASHFDHIRVV